ncbi:NAD-dependent epimerase/dehydratase family protein [Chitinophaga qingshengii]|uniref:NAD-dependent epimerase/dehydratase family protein n=1 Tax=Chitinophaga qingshengii TaxID=1569794 RepID=A0ABR7TX10_9BACT|nr:NAD-dependent epimerase/dehydratase family protein [Chitinophaga qingshengii]MBC9935011.1 NAD-dependent epimerase/dehydratase family protein [Chitinophaga qingshengii]
MKIAITGAMGYIGSVLTPLLLAQGHQLRIHARKTQAPVTGVTYVYGSLLDPDFVAAFVQDMDAVIHMAAVISVSDTPDMDAFHFNTATTRLLTEVAQRSRVRRFLLISSITAYEQAPYDMPMDETRPYTQGMRYSYDHSKAVSQETALAANGPSLEVLVLAPTAVIGPFDQRPSLIGDAVIRIYQGKIPAIFPGGVDFVDVRQVANAIVQALTAGTPGQAYILSGEWMTLKTLSAHIARIKGKRIFLPVVPLWLVMGSLPLVRAWARLTGGAPYYTRQSVYNLTRSNRKIDNSKARRELGFQPGSLVNTLQDTIAWFKENRMLS